MTKPVIDAQTQIELEAAAFRRLRQHLMQDRTDVQNIDMMNLAGFCRNCLSRWYQEAANDKGIEMDKAQAREIFYGMTMDEWKANYQTDAGADKQEAFKKSFAENVGTDKGRRTLPDIKRNEQRPRIGSGAVSSVAGQILHTVCTGSVRTCA